MKTEIFKAFADYLKPARFKVAYGGRGSGKTRQFVAILLNNVKFYGWRLVCFREIMRSIEDSLYEEFIEEIKRRGDSDNFNTTKNYIESLESGGIIKFDGLFRNTQKLKGYANFDGALVEEAENVSSESWKHLIPTIRKNGSEIWVIFNPENPINDTYQRFVTNRIYPDFLNGKRFCIVKKINYTDNPRFPDELRQDMELLKERNYNEYLHIYEGEPVAHSELAIIKPEWINAAIDAHIKLKIQATGHKIIGFDVADGGSDKNAIVLRKGFLTINAKSWKDMDAGSAAHEVRDIAINENANKIIYDNIGVGAGAKESFKSIKKIVVIGFNAGGKVVNPDADYKIGKKNKDQFYNAKSQAWWIVRDLFENTYFAVEKGKEFSDANIISLSSSIEELEQLKNELSQPRRDFLNGKIIVESKKTMKKRGIRSPNIADALICAYSIESNNIVKSIKTSGRRTRYG